MHFSLHRILMTVNKRQIRIPLKIFVSYSNHMICHKINCLPDNLKCKNHEGVNNILDLIRHLFSMHFSYFILVPILISLQKPTLTTKSFQFNRSKCNIMHALQEERLKLKFIVFFYYVIIGEISRFSLFHNIHLFVHELNNHFVLILFAKQRQLYSRQRTKSCILHGNVQTDTVPTQTLYV